ncbi:MAG: DUF502 domain-containing protein, partial [Candidatus Omnitrophota bacterium]|nr:DUF502 domain-containing protein [Candidatus Omnitrophota bacterium]
MSKIKHYFVTGLLITLPVFFTFYLLYIVFIFIDGIWGKAINFYLRKYLGFSIPGLGIMLGLVTILAVGFIATNFIGKKIFKIFETWFLKIPFIRKIYPAARQIVDSFISRRGSAFKKVVLVEYPSAGIWSAGFITNDSFREANVKTGEDLVHVLIGTTPTPFSGFTILVPRNKVKVLDISVEEGIKL